MKYLNPSDGILKHGRKLPHWQQGDAMQFVTFRLGDAMPAGKLRQWKEERDIWHQVRPQPWSQTEEDDYHKRFTRRLEGGLDQGAGSCLFINPANGRSWRGC